MQLGSRLKNAKLPQVSDDQRQITSLFSFEKKNSFLVELVILS